MRMLLCCAGCVCTLFRAWQGALAGERATPLWKPITDTPYLQEVGQRIPISKPIRALAVLAGSVYAGFGDGVRRLEPDGRWAATRGGPQEYVERMRTINDKLFVFTKKALHHFDDARWTQIGTGHHVDIVAFAEKLVVTTSRSLFEFREGALHPLPGGEVSPGPIQPLGNYSETLYCLGYDRLFTFDGRDFDHKNVALQGRRSGFIPAWGNAPGFWM
ncbi:MAG: hypothetical protein L3K26_14495 [Candidatus Hydrogenedentes bacterium]|nr:hypothetical protein [Candidatus Hydrogenedentota bacterium]